ncbi:MAG: YhbY family RNA-binding protein [Clostridia bacterium]|nr:YhbY family RNA-binding protein [Clostridia bacterium]
MLNSKQRAKLRSLASTYEPMIIIGKDGLTDNILEQIDKQLFAHEMVKISVLDGAEKSAKEYLGEVASALNAEEVCSIGRKFVVYKMSNKKGLKHIEY